MTETTSENINYTVNILNTKESVNANILKKATPGSLGYDIYSTDKYTIVLEPGDSYVFKTGMYLELPENLGMLILSRSGMSVKGLVVANAPGLIDTDYRGEIKIILYNISKTRHILLPNTKLAQAIFTVVEKPSFCLKDELKKTRRGTNGLGSTGI